MSAFEAHGSDFKRMNKKGLSSINVGLSFAFSIVVIITSACISGVLFFNMHSVMYDDLNKRMQDMVAAGRSCALGLELIPEM